MKKGGLFYDTSTCSKEEDLSIHSKSSKNYIYIDRSGQGQSGKNKDVKGGLGYDNPIAS
jgi:hypothetical protein